MLAYQLKVVYINAAVPSVLLSGSQTRPLRAEDVRRLSVFDHQCLRSIARIWWEGRISNAEVRRMVFGRQNVGTIDELIRPHRLHWLGHVLRMPSERLLRKALFPQPCTGWKRPRDGQFITWRRNINELTSALSRVGNCHLP